MRVAQVIDSIEVSHGGPSECAVRLNAALREIGVDAKLHTVSHPDDVWSAGACPAYADSAGELVRSLPAAIKAADVVHIHGFYGPVPAAAGILARALRKPYVLHAHGVFEPYEWSRSQAKRRVFNAVAGRAVLGGVSWVLMDTKAEVAAARWPAGAPRATVLPLAGESFVPAEVPDRDGKNFLFLSRIAAKKRVDLLLAAWPDVVAKFPEATLTIAGGDDEGLLAAAYAKLPESTRPSITLTGQVSGDAKQKLLQDSDFFVLPSENENFGIAVAEAASAGLGLVLSEHVALAQPLADAGAAVVLDMLDAGELARTMIGLLAEPKRGRGLREAALAYGREHFGWKRVARDARDVYTETAAR